MTKRELITVLLASGDFDGRRIINLAPDMETQNRAYEAFEVVSLDMEAIGLNDALGRDRYWYTATEAAYRLIETSATLRKEWFGR